MGWMYEEGSLEWLDARLRMVGEWLLVGYTVALLLVTFVGPQRFPPDPEETTAPVALDVVF